MKKLVQNIKSKSEKHFINIFKAIIISSIASSLIIGSIYAILPKSSWITVSTEPADFKLHNVSGEAVLSTNSITVNQCVLTNKTQLARVSINGEIIDLSYGDLVITFANELDPDFEFYIENEKEDFPEYLARTIFFYEPVLLRGSTGRSNSTTNIQIISEPSADLKQYKAGTNLDNKYYDEYHNILIKSDGDMSFHVSVHNNNILRVTHFMRIFIKGEDTELPCGTEIRFISPNDIDNADSEQSSDEVATYLILSTDAVYFNDMYNSDYCYLKGDCSSIIGKSSRNGSIKQTYLNTQTEYDIGSLSIEATPKGYFEIEYELNEETNDIIIAGKAKDVSIADTPLGFNWSVFLSENLSAIVIAFFTSFITVYLPLCYEAANKESKMPK